MTGRHTALVTGAASGVGRGIASRLTETGSRVLAVDRDPAVLDAFAEAQVLDLTDAAAIGAFVPPVDQLDVVVNAAGLWHRAPFAESRPPDWSEQIEANLTGPIHLLHRVLPMLTRSAHGRVVNVISDAARSGERGVAVYAAAKAGLAGFSRCLALELAPYGVTVNCVSLSAIDTPGLGQTFTNAERANMSRHYPLGRIGTVDDVVHSIEYLLHAGWVTGQTLVVNGGYVMT